MLSKISEPAPTVRTLRVLLADDQPDVLTALSLLLKSEGWSTKSVSTPAEILEAIENDSFDAVLMDLNYSRATTSGEEGLELLRRIESVDEPPPVIVMTAWGSIDLAVEAMRRGARDFIIKPWDNQKLLETLRRHARLEPEHLEAVRNDRYSSDEFEVASQVQQKLLPEQGRVLDRLEISGHCLPAGAVGGDSFDFIELGPGSTGFRPGRRIRKRSPGRLDDGQPASHPENRGSTGVTGFADLPIPGEPSVLRIHTTPSLRDPVFRRLRRHETPAPICQLWSSGGNSASPGRIDRAPVEHCYRFRTFR